MQLSRREERTAAEGMCKLNITVPDSARLVQHDVLHSHVT
jgi:hypothetical protein